MPTNSSLSCTMSSLPRSSRFIIAYCAVASNKQSWCPFVRLSAPCPQFKTVLFRATVTMEQ